MEPPPPLLYLSEDKRWSLIVGKVEKDFKQKYGVPNWLEHSESPFKWMQSLESFLLCDSKLPDKMHDYKNQGADYGFEKYSILLSIMFMKGLKSDDPSTEEEPEVSDDEYFPRSLRHVDPEQAYRMCKAALDEMAEHEGDIMYTRIGPAMEHVLLATRAQILYLNGNVAESQEIAANIKPVKEMSTENLAGIEGIKAKFTLSVYQKVQVPLEASRRAEELDPAFAAWKYLTGKILRRIRRDSKEKICNEELEQFKKAVDLERNPKFIVFLAQSYQEMAISILKQENIAPYGVAEEMIDKAANLFRECWRLKKDSAAIARRVGNGMMKMKGNQKVPGLTKEALLKAVELSPCVVTYHSLGKFYLDFEQDEEKALECFKKVGSIYGTGEIIRFNLIKSYPLYDPHDLIQYWIEMAVNIVKRDNVYCDVGWYYLVFKNDLFMAVKFFWSILKRDFNSFRVLKFQSFAFCVSGPINMLRILVNEIKLLNTDSHDCPMEKKKIDFLNQFLEKVCEKHPDLAEISPISNLLDHRKQDVEKYILGLRKKFKPDQQFYTQRRENTSSCWRVRDSEAVNNNEEHSSPMSRSYERNHEEATNRNSKNQEGTERFDNREYRNGMRFDRNRECNSRFDRSYGGNSRFERSHEGIDRLGENSRFESNEGESSMNVANPRFDNRSVGSSRFQTDRDQNSRGEGRTMDNRRPYYNNYNSNRYDTTVTNWRSKSKE